MYEKEHMMPVLVAFSDWSCVPKCNSDVISDFLFIFRREKQMEYMALAKTYLECGEPKLSLKCLFQSKEFRLCAELCKKLGKVWSPLNYPVLIPFLFLQPFSPHITHRVIAFFGDMVVAELNQVFKRDCSREGTCHRIARRGMKRTRMQLRSWGLFLWLSSNVTISHFCFAVGS